MKLSDRIRSVAPSATTAMTQAARELRAQGKEVISLSVGEPDFAVPDHILDAANTAMRDGHTGYTSVDGIPELKEAICEKFAKDNGLSVTPEQINVSPGGKAVIWNALAVTLTPGDDVIIPTPCWVSYPEMVRLCGANPVLIPGKTGFKITPEQLTKAITSRTRWLMLNSPSNPPGAVYSVDELRALADVLRNHPQVMILSDDIYEKLVYGGTKFATMASVAPDLAERTLTMNGVSKAYAMTGFRIGYAAGPKALIDAMRKFMGQTTTNPCSVSQWAALAALDGPQDFLSEWRATYAERRDMMVGGLKAIGFDCDIPDGAFYVFANCERIIEDKGLDSDNDLAMALLNEAGVATVPGSAFQSPGHIRLSYAASMDSIEAAIERMEAYLKT